MSLKSGAWFAAATLFAWGALPVHAQSFQHLNDLNGDTGYRVAYGVSGDGSLVVGRASAPLAPNQAACWPSSLGGAAVPLPDIPGGTQHGSAYGANLFGTLIVGYGVPEDSNPTDSVPTESEACCWVGSGSDWSLVRLGDLPGAFVSSVAWATSDNGGVIVGIGLSAGGFEPVRWVRNTAGVYEITSLGLEIEGVRFTRAEARGVSHSGRYIVGYGTTTGGRQRGFVWSAQTGPRLLPLPAGIPNNEAYAVTESASGVTIIGRTGAPTGIYAARWHLDYNNRVAGFQITVGAEGWMPNALAGNESAILSDAPNATLPGGSETMLSFDDARGDRNLRELLESEYGLDLTGWVLNTGRGLSFDGRIVTGWGTKDGRTLQGWKALLNHRPIAVPDTAQTTVNQPVSIPVLANDTDRDGDPIILSAFGSNSAQGTVTVNEDFRSLTFLPAPGFQGTTTVEYWVKDAYQESVSPAFVTVTVAPGPPNHAPRAMPDHVETWPGFPITIDVLANDTDPDEGDRANLRVVAVTAPDQPYGTVEISADKKRITYTPPFMELGPIHFTYTVSDGRGGVSIGQVKVIVMNGG